MEKAINISIVLYNTDPSEVVSVIRCCSSCLVHKIYFVDNSPVSDLKKYCVGDNVVYIFNPSNPGFGAAHNLALSKSIRDSSLVKFHLVLNVDVEFESHVIDDIYKYMLNENEVSHVMPKILNEDGSVQFLCKLLPTPFNLIIRRFLPNVGIFREMNELFELRASNYDEIMEVPYLSGCFMFLRVVALKEIGVFDERFFMYPEDIDLTRRMNRLYKTIYYPLVSVVHKHGKESYTSKKMLWVHVVNIFRYFNKWGWFFDKERSSVNRRIVNQLTQAR